MLLRLEFTVKIECGPQAYVYSNVESNPLSVLTKTNIEVSGWVTV